MAVDKPKTGSAARRARQADALRRNLLRRKEQARAKEAPGGVPPANPETTDDGNPGSQT